MTAFEKIVIVTDRILLWIAVLWAIGEIDKLINK